MAFFDDFSKRVTQMSQDAVAKTKSMTDTAKYRSQISDEERKITECYRRIGELYYSVRGEQDFPAYQTLIKDIDDAKAKISELNHLIMVSKGIVICPNCGAELSANSAFCVKCGTRIVQPQPTSAQPEQETEAEAQEAPQTEPVQEEAEQSAEETAANEETQPEPDPAVGEETSAQSEQAQVRFCTKCGARLTEDQKFCTQCGSPV